MTEIELKFQMPPERAGAVLRAVATRSAQRIGLRALYFDTAERSLATSGLALRVRKEGRRWVQTLKGAGDGVWQRLEHEVTLRVPAGSEPLADPALHDGTPAGEALRKALATGSGELHGIYGTQVMRTRRLLRAPDCLVELAFDQGALTADGRRWPLCELEFELKGGSASALAAVAQRWATRFGLTLDTRTKAERGDRLARDLRLGEPVKSQALALPATVDTEAALRAMVGNCLLQILGNASELAHETDTPPEHLHQLRVGLRRLRSVLRELGEASPQARPEWSDALAQIFSRLGSARDRDALAQTLLPALRQAGATGLQLPQIDPEPAAQIVLREPATMRLWLELAAFAAEPGTAGEPAATLVRQRLGRLFKQIRRDAARFDGLADDARHQLRKRVKRLRYLGELSASLYRPKAVREFLRQLSPAQEALGAFNDVCVARALFAPQGAHDAMAMFALGWLARERDVAIKRCVRALAPLRKAEPFWLRPVHALSNA